MNLSVPERDRLIELRRALHRHPEPAWCEFYTTARIVEAVEAIGVDELHVGPEAIDPRARTEVPDDATLGEWFERAREAGADPAILDRLAGGVTGAVAVLRRGEGPVVGLRVDIDALPREEADDDTHEPAARGFRSETPAMHACGHDAHATVGVGVLETIANSTFEGTLKVFFQPAEEMIAGAQAMVERGHLDDVEYLLSLHVGLDHPTGEIVAGYVEALAVSHFDIEYTGESAHAGRHPERGRNAVQALATTVQNLYAIPRHADGSTRVNAGIVHGGSATNIIPEQATIQGEVRGETTSLRDYMLEHVERIATAGGRTHGCETAFEVGSSAPGADSDPELAELVASIAEGVEGVERVLDRAALGASEDVTYLMRAVQRRGGLATFVGVGTDHPEDHHTARFDVDEASIPMAVEILSGTILAIGREPPLTT